MEHGSKQLRAWLERSHLDQRNGAKALEMHFTTLNKLLSGLRSPGREMAIRMETKTGIPVAAWSTRVAKRRRGRPSIAKSANVDRATTHV